MCTSSTLKEIKNSIDRKLLPIFQSGLDSTHRKFNYLLVCINSNYSELIQTGTRHNAIANSLNQISLGIV